jgi:hypothetical protein
MFVVYLTIYGGDKFPPYYIGSTSLEKFNGDYYGSVCSKKYGEIFHRELLENPNLFDKIILETTDTREDALIKERDYHVKCDVVKNENFINLSFAVSGCYGLGLSGDEHPMWGKKHTKETIEMIRGYTVVSDDGGETWKRIPSEQYNPEIHTTPRGEFNHNTTEATRLRVKEGTHHFCDKDVQRKIQEKRKLNGWVHKDKSNLGKHISENPFYVNSVRSGGTIYLYACELYVDFLCLYDPHKKNFRTPLKKRWKSYNFSDKAMNTIIHQFKEGWKPFLDKPYLEWKNESS